MAYETLQDVLRDIDRRGPAAHLGQRDDLTHFIAHAMQKADAEWEKVAEATDDITEAYHRGRVHAICELLGDQDWLHTALDRRPT